MYKVVDYMTNETVAICSRKQDALALIQDKDQKLIVEKG